MNNRIHIAIAEPSPIIRRGVVSVLNNIHSIDIDTAEIVTLGSLINDITLAQPNILFINPHNIVNITPSQLRERVGNPNLKIIALVTTLLDSSITSNFDGSISLYDSIETIATKITDAIDRDVADKSGGRELSSREKEIIVCVVKGMTNKMIADHLFLSTHTVISHRRNIAAKLQISSSAGLTIYAIVNKLVDLSQIAPKGENCDIL